MYIKEIVIMSLLTVVIGGSIADIVHDYREGADAAHLLIEGVLVATSFSLIAILSYGIWRQSRSNRQLKRELKSLQNRQSLEFPPRVQAARHSLAVVAQEQFETWQLTQTEREIAMLLLKGLSFKEMAVVRDTAEKTVRQQASAIYRKAGVNGRHAFSAWFIEDIL